MPDSPLPLWWRKVSRFGGLLWISGTAMAASLSPLAPPPDWDSLHLYHTALTKNEFKALVDTVYSTDGTFWKYARMTDDGVTVYRNTDTTQALYSLYFAPDAKSRFVPPRGPRTLSAEELPLRGLRICLDPGHIGGAFAKMEERSFKIGEDPPVEEGALTLMTCQHLARYLQEAGAEVVWTKQKLEPVTPLRPEQLREAALAWFKEYGPTDREPTEREIKTRCEHLFYRSAEIRARATLVQQLQPDLTLCVHYNAAAWGDPRKPALTPSSRLVVFVSGHFMEDELKYDDQKFEFLRKTFGNTFPVELLLATSIADALRSHMALPPESYSAWKAVQQVGPSPYVFARNLAANRTFPGPVIFIEGPYMNSEDTYPWIVAGDYDGEREIAGKVRRSIHREFAQAMANGVLNYFREHPITPSPVSTPLVLWNP